MTSRRRTTTINLTSAEALLQRLIETHNLTLDQMIVGECESVIPMSQPVYQQMALLTLALLEDVGFDRNQRWELLTRLLRDHDFRIASMLNARRVATTLHR